MTFLLSQLTGESSFMILIVDLYICICFIPERNKQKNVSSPLDKAYNTITKEDYF